MDMMAAIAARHAVRAYTDRRIEGETLVQLQAELEACNRNGGLHIQLVTDEPEAFGGLMARYGRFENVRNYVALVGPDEPELDEKAGYYGERVVLRAQQLGLNTCWVALTFSKRKTRCEIGPGEKLALVIAIGYGATPGKDRKSKGVEEVCRASGEMPAWFRRGVQSALLAPTAMNQQKFLITLNDRNATGSDAFSDEAADSGLRPCVSATATGGPYSKVDLGIVKLHFEIGAGLEHFSWAYV